MDVRLRLVMLVAVLAASAEVSFHPEKLHFPPVAFLFQACIIIPSRSYAAMQRVHFFDSFRIVGNMFVLPCSYRPLP